MIGHQFKITIRRSRIGIDRCRQTIKVVLVLALVGLVAACAATTREIDPQETLHYDANYDFSDKQRIVEDLSASLMNAGPLSSREARPVLIIYGISNQTAEHISTSGIADDIQLRLLQSGRYRFISRAQRESLIEELDYQNSGALDPAQITRLGRQSGAEYLLGGALRSIEKKQPRQWRLNKKKLVYYTMNLELTSLESGEIVWADSIDLAREASRPIIGW